MFKFLGLGSAFNTTLGNTSCYIKKEESLLLIDCGGTVFHTIRKYNLLDSLKHVHIIITHTHPDHIGSLGEVIFYAYYILKIRPKIYHPNLTMLKSLFACTGVKDEMVELYGEQAVVIKDEHLWVADVSFIPVSHLDTVDAYGFLMKYENRSIYYSGDANMIPDEILSLLMDGKLDQLYQDTCGLDYDGNAHLSLNKLSQLIPTELRKQVYCMHLDEHISVEEIRNLGFKIPDKVVDE